jgi:hypothetical protein
MASSRCGSAPRVPTPHSARPPPSFPLAERLAAERPERIAERESAEEESGQLAFDLAA